MCNNYIYSIIIPHRNIPKLLQRCLDSIPRRDDIQIIVVDDNSDTDKVDFEHFPGLNDPYVEVYFDKLGKGAGRARNVGLDHAKGKWLIFADADDYFYPGAFEILDVKVKNGEYDIIYFYCDSRDGQTGEKIKDRVGDIKRGIESNDQNLLRYKSYVPWGKVVNHELVQRYNIRFEEIEVSNDVMFSTLAGFYSTRVGTIADCLYCCTRNKSSLVYAVPSKTRIKTRIRAGARVNSFMHSNGVKGYWYNALYYIFLLFPKSPFTFIWAVWKGRNHDAKMEYMKLVEQRVMISIKNLFRKR